MNPLLVAVLMAALTAGAGAWTVQRWRCDSARVKSIERAIEQADEINRQNYAVETASVTRLAKIDTQFKVINRDVIRYVETHAQIEPVECLDADGLRLWRDAHGDADAEAGSHPDPPLPAVADAGIGESAGSADQSY